MNANGLAVIVSNRYRARRFLAEMVQLSDHYLHIGARPPQGLVELIAELRSAIGPEP